jgi:pSer/pThr/pTyr-binding forkhead associated (FHA) protein
MSPRKLVRKKGAKGKAKKSTSSPESKKKNATTMPIPVDAIFDDLPTDHTMAVQVTIPGKQPFTVPADDPELVIGRESHCAVYLPIDNVSREHARILRSGETFTLEDLDSTNGTFVNNVRIVSCTLHQSDQIRIGQARITLVRINPA